MKNIRSLVWALLAICLVSSCAHPKDLVYQDIEHFSVSKLALSKSTLSLNIKMFNPNTYGMKLKNADVDVFINDRYLGKMMMDTLFTIPRLESFLLPVSLQVDMKNILPNALQLLLDNEVTVKLQGHVKVGKHLYVTVPVNYEGKQKLFLN
ncbi:MAG: LEA type 2 family protein [Bacteroidota bacterium]